MLKVSTSARIKRAQRHARDRFQSPQHDDHKRAQQKRDARSPGSNEKSVASRGPGDAGEGDAHPEGEAGSFLVVHADDPSRVTVLDERAHRAAEPGAAERDLQHRPCSPPPPRIPPAAAWRW